MPFHIVRNDITRMPCDAVVNAANSSLLGGGGVDGAIHRAAGPKLREYCAKLGGCPAGRAVMTPGFELPARYIIHTVGPIWQGGSRGEAETLASCYRESLNLARKAGCRSVAFPLISAGAYGYPRAQAFELALREIGDFLRENEMEVWLVVYDSASFLLGSSRFSELESYIDETWIAAHPSPVNNAPGSRPPLRPAAAEDSGFPAAEDAVFAAMQAPSFAYPISDAQARPAAAKPSKALRRERKAAGKAAEQAAEAGDAGLRAALSSLDESFSEMLMRKIDEKGLTDAACYKKANVDRKLFSKIRSDRLYRPSKPTALAFAIALELPLEETADLLRKAGFALSHSSKFDVIIEYFISRGNYDIFAINEALFAFDQSLLGA